MNSQLNTLTNEDIQRATAGGGSRRKIRLFYIHSSSQRDFVYKDEYRTRLAALSYQQLLDPWCADDCIAGSTLSAEVKERLNSAEIITPLLSPDFVAKNELVEQVTACVARQKIGEARVIPIILRPVDLPRELAGLECLPTEPLPISRWVDSDLAWENVSYGLVKASLEIRFPLNGFKFAVSAKNTAKAILILRINPENVDKDLLFEMLQNIREISLEFAMELEKIVPGSTILIIKGPHLGINRLYYEYRYNNLRKICNVELEDVIPLTASNSQSRRIALTEEERSIVESISDEKKKLSLVNIFFKKELTEIMRVDYFDGRLESLSDPDIRIDYISTLETVCNDFDLMVKTILKLGFKIAERKYIRTRFASKVNYPENLKCIDLGRFDIGIILNKEGRFDLISDWDGIRATTGRTGSETADLISREFSYESAILFFYSRGFSLDSETRESDEIQLVGVSWSTGRRKVIQAFIDKKGIITYSELADKVEADLEQNILKLKT